MESIMVFMPILIMLIVAAIIVRIALRANRLLKNPSKLSYVKKVKWMFGSYIAVLVLAMAVFYLLPGETQSVSGKQESKEQVEPFYLYEKADRGEIGSVPEKYIQEKWQFTLNDDTLVVSVSHNEIPIFVEVSGDLQNTVEAFYYQTPVVIEGIDFTERLKAPGLSFASNVLTYTKPETAEIELGIYQTSLVTRQFTGETWMGGNPVVSGEIFYLRIPEGVELKHGDFAFIEYVNQ